MDKKKRAKKHMLRKIDWSSHTRTVGYSSGWGHHRIHNNKTNEINMLAKFEVSLMVIDRVSSLVKIAVGLRNESALRRRMVGCANLRHTCRTRHV